MLRRAALLLVLSTAVACGGPSSPPAAERQVGAEADDPVAALVEVTAVWQCDRARHTYESLDEIETLRRSTLEAAGLTVAAHDAFLDRLETEPELRQRVRDAFVVECR